MCLLPWSVSSAAYLHASLPLLSYPELVVRSAIGRSIAGYLHVHLGAADETVAALIALFEKHSTGIALTKVSSWLPRHGVMLTFEAAAARGVR